MKILRVTAAGRKRHRKQEGKRQRKRHASCVVAVLPNDIIVSHILPKLPVKSLVRFKCVCKSWRSLICNPSFSDQHLALSKELRLDGGGIILIRYDINHEEDEDCDVECGSLRDLFPTENRFLLSSLDGKHSTFL